MATLSRLWSVVGIFVCLEGLIFIVNGGCIPSNCANVLGGIMERVNTKRCTFSQIYITHNI